MNAPTAEEKLPSGVVDVASRAAPGVDQAIVIGVRSPIANTMKPNPIVTHRTASPEVACSASAPIAANPAKTTANDHVTHKPRHHAGQNALGRLGVTTHGDSSQLMCIPRI